MDPPACAQDYIGQLGRLNLHSLDAEIDVMVESKAKELSLLLYRQALRFGPIETLQDGLRPVGFRPLDQLEGGAQHSCWLVNGLVCADGCS